MLGLTAHFPYLADLAEFRRQAEWKFLHYGNQLRQQGSVGGQSLAEEAEQWGTIYSKPSLRAPYVDDGPKDVGFFYDANGTRRLIPVSRDPDDYDSSMRERLQQRPAAISD